ncbi:MAG TPA: hypothetical protein VLB27_10225 [candidate division Zixibacteria bacterium]|nr:hypothetical protein [candidate division Zixibacteria bacterium]
MRRQTIHAFLALGAVIIAGSSYAVEPRISVQPEYPQPNDTVFISISGWLPNPCYQQEFQKSRGSSLISYTLTSTDLGVPCIQVIADYRRVDTIAGLPVGWYRAEVVERMYWPDGWLWRTDFDAVEFVVGDSAEVLNECTPCVAGDADGSGICNIGDAVYLIARIFSGGPAPVCEAEGDADLSGSVNISDVSRLVMYVFGGAPLESCGGP